MRNYNSNFDRDFNWYLSVRRNFNFDGSENYFNKKGIEIVQYDKNGVNGKEAFFQWDSNGKIIPTKHPNILFTVLKTKGSVNLHIKMYAEDRARGYLPKIEFDKICQEFNAPEWFREAVENQKGKYYELLK